ncbi:hypothetical protein PENSUB_11973 [Penicillium subrubescens]|uniref:Uncharacterized protein n=1 Tax=Penicillium subrubescens TaxID=1316194 RepID=A0A1Q5T0C4_9EURO|nr:hypothetical protein PENSUB_11973 [Penicillium subrubescens]
MAACNIGSHTQTSPLDPVESPEPPGLLAVRGTNQRTHALALASVCGVPDIAGPRRSEWSHEEEGKTSLIVE